MRMENVIGGHALLALYLDTGVLLFGSVAYHWGQFTLLWFRLADRVPTAYTAIRREVVFTYTNT